MTKYKCNTILAVTNILLWHNESAVVVIVITTYILTKFIFCSSDVVDRITMHLKFNPTEVQIHDFSIMKAHFLLI